MPSAEGSGRERVQRARESVFGRIREAMLTGVAVVVPILITLYVLSVAFGVVTDVLDPLVLVLEELGVTPDASELIVGLVSAAVMVVLTGLVGFAASFKYGQTVLGFSTTETPHSIATAAGHDEMQTLFLPLAPNPVMGGHLTHVPKDRVMDVDMTVEEGMRTVVTMGVAISAGDEGADGLSRQRLEQLSGQDVAESKPREDST